MAKKVFFLGAGATIDVVPDAPSNKDLVKKALNDFGDKPAGKRVLKFIDSIFGRSNPPIDNKVWNLLDYIIQQGKSPSPDYNLENILELRDDLLELIIEEFKKSLDSRHISHNTYNTFAGLVRDSEITSAIISTNYDIFIDNALEESRCFNYGAKLRCSVNRLASGSIRGFKRPDRCGGMELNTGNIQLLKIHGSLNWLYCSKCDEVDITNGEKLGAEDLKELYCVDHNCTNRYESLLITPTMFKNYENRIIKEIWSCAEKELTTAEEIVFIGYSLKDEDYHIKCLLMKALLGKSTPKYDKITVVEQISIKNEKLAEENIRKKYEDLYGASIVDFKPIGFAGYVTEMRSIAKGQ